MKKRKRWLHLDCLRRNFQYATDDRCSNRKYLMKMYMVDCIEQQRDIPEKQGERNLRKNDGLAGENKTKANSVLHVFMIDVNTASNSVVFSMIECRHRQATIIY